MIKKIKILDNSIMENALMKHKEFKCEKFGESILDYAKVDDNGKILCPVCAQKDIYYKVFE